MKYKSSQYNIWKKRNEGTLLYNTFSTGLIELQGADGKLIENAFERREFDVLSERFITVLRDNGFILAEQIDELSLVKYRYRVNAYDGSVLGVSLLPTTDCNFKCPYCFEHANDNAYMNDNDQNQVLAFIENEFKGNSVKSFEYGWYGGEPLLAVPVIKNLSQGIKKLCERYTISLGKQWMITNGYFLDDDLAKTLKSIDIESIQISLDGDKGEHEKSRLSKDGSPTFDRLMDAIRIASDYFNEVAVRFNVTRKTIGSVRELIEREDIFSKKNVKPSLGMLKCYLGSNCDAEADIDMFKGTEIIKLQWDFDKYARKRRNEGLNHDLFQFPVKASSCSSDRLKSFILGPQRKIYKCIEHVSVGDEVGYINNGAFKPRPEYWKWIVNEPFDNQYCRECTYLPVCMGGCPSIRERIGVPNDEVCGYWKEWINCKLEEINGTNAIMKGGDFH